jgi:hypothetical protein
LIPLSVWTSGAAVGLVTAVSTWVTDPAQVKVWLTAALQIMLPLFSNVDKLTQ